MDKNKLFVGNLPWTATTDSLREMFTAFGEITDVIVITDRYTGRSKGFGFVTFANEEDAQKAIAEMGDKEIEGRKIVVNVAKPREERPARSGGSFRRDDRRSY